MKKANAVGGLYFLVHFLLEVTSFYLMTEITHSPYVWVLMLLYDFTAFVPQGVFGWLRDRGIRVNYALVGTILTSAATVCYMCGANVFFIVTVLSLGNCLVHIHGAETTLRTSPGRISPAAVFVSGGSFGVITGKLFSTYHVAAPWVLALGLFSLVPIFLAEKLKAPEGTENLRQYRFDDPKVNTAFLLAAATLVVAVRAYMGYGIPTPWNKTVVQTIALYVCMGVGKALGGVLIDAIGIRKTAFISTLVALPLLCFGEGVMAVSLIGIAFFSMTMAVTLALLVSRLQDLPGVAFGFTTLGLFLGTVPVFFFRIESVLVNCVVISALTVVCVVLLYILCVKKTHEKGEIRG